MKVYGKNVLNEVLSNPPKIKKLYIKLYQFHFILR